MPVTYERDPKTGKFRRVESGESSGVAFKKPPNNSPQRQQQPAIGQKAKLNGKPVVWSGSWGWQSPGSHEKLKREGRMNGPRNPLEWMKNELRWMKRQVDEADKNFEATGVMAPGGAAPFASAGLFGGMPVPPVGQVLFRNKETGKTEYSPPSQRQAIHGATAQAATNAVLGATNLAQRVLTGKLGTPTDPETTAIGRAVTDWNRKAATALGATPPDELPPDQRGVLTDLPASISANALAALVPGGGALGAGASRVTGLGLSRVPFLSPGMKQILERGVRWGGQAGFNEAVSGLLDDSSQAGPGNLLQALGVPVPDAFVVDPKRDDRVSGAVRSIVPGLAIGETLGLGASAVGGLVGKAQDLAPNAMRRLREQRIKNEAQAARQETVNTGVQQQDPDTGEYSFTTPPTVQPEVATAPATPEPQKPKTWRQAAEEWAGPRPDAEPPTATAQPGVVEPEAAGPGADAATPAREVPSQEVEPGGEVPVAEPEADSWVDPSLPEVDAPAIALGRLDDDQLRAVAAGEGPVLDRLEGVMAEQQLPQPDPMVSTAMTGAQREVLADPVVSFEAQWESLPTSTLQQLASPQTSADLFEQVQGLTGKPWEDFTRGDVLDGLRLLQDTEGVTVMPNRLRGEGRNVPVDQIAVDPARFQFKSGVDAQGQQKGNSLSGVSRWNPDAEGVLQVWDDPADGRTFVVNGHNRLAKAKELGIPTVRVETLPGDAVQARALGAISNISSGGGTVFDAAKFLRDSGVTDPVQLKNMGIPLDSGFGAKGLALARLPQNIFQDAVDGRLTQKRAVILGGSGLDEASMQQAYKVLQGRDLTDDQFNEVLQQARNAPVVQGSQVDLFGNTDTLNLMVEKAKVADAVRSQLINDKNLFGSASRNAKKLKRGGNVIDAESSSAISMDAKALLGEFDATKYAAGTPTTELLNQAALELSQGAPLQQVATRVREQLVLAAKNTPMDIDAAIAALGLSADELKKNGLNPRRVESMKEADPERLMAEIERLRGAREAIDARAAEQAAAVAAAEPSPSTRALAEKYGLNPRQAAKWEAMDPAELEALTQGWQDDLLTPRKLSNRLKKQQSYEQQVAEVEQYNRETPGSGDPAELSEEAFLAKYGADEDAHPQLPSDAGTRRAIRELEAHQVAERSLAWLEEFNGTRPLRGDERNAIKTQLLGEAVANGEVRPSATPVSATPDPGGVDLNAGLRDLEQQLQTKGVVDPGTPAAQLIEDEVRLGAEYSQRDAAIKTELNRAERQAIGYDEMSFDQKVADGGIADGWEVPPAITPEVVEDVPIDQLPKLADQFQELMDRMYESDKRMFKAVDGVLGVAKQAVDMLGEPLEIPPAASRKITARTSEGRVRGAAESLISWTTPPGGGAPLFTLEQAMDVVRRKKSILDVDKVPGVDLDAALNDKTMGRSTPATDAAAQAYRQFYEVGEPRRIGLQEPSPQTKASRFRLPEELSGAKPRYGYRDKNFTVEFESDLDKVAYTLANDAKKPSKQAGKFRAAVEAAGLDLKEVVAHGRKVREALKAEAKSAPAGELRLAELQFGDEPGPVRVEVETELPEGAAADAYQRLSSTLMDADPKLRGKGDRLAGLSQKALKELDQGKPELALQEAAAIGQQRVAQLEGEIQSIKQRAIEEGC